MELVVVFNDLEVGDKSCPTPLHIPAVVRDCQNVELLFDCQTNDDWGRTIL
jgi:hypothetical protein